MTRSAKKNFLFNLNLCAGGRQQQMSTLLSPHTKENVEFAQAQNSEGESDMKEWFHPASDYQQASLLLGETLSRQIYWDTLGSFFLKESRLDTTPIYL